ncbi:hypothetical protein MHEL_03700 [Mycolicibacterium helvum]|uniref:Uncharacterized protein n=1 Tax=Mycolicibacterium helvum TaxID=1534349 RepID=A0A7I7SYN5_9MYCO|nr:hypothetical protein MHEL_03700 [Mycolicibacterium helvum]
MSPPAVDVAPRTELIHVVHLSDLALAASGHRQPPGKADPRDVPLAAVSSSSLPSNEVTRADVLKPFVQLADWVGRWVELGAFIALAPVFAPTLELFHYATAGFTPGYLDTVRWFVERALTNRFKIATGAAATGNHVQSSSVTASTTDAAQQLGPSDAALTAPAAASRTATNNIAVFPERIDRAIRKALFIITLPVSLPIIAAGFVTNFLCVTGCSQFVQQLADLTARVGSFFFPSPSASVSVTAASVVTNREMSSAAADSANTTAPKASLAASRRSHSTGADQGSASKHLAAKQDRTVVRVAAKQADPQKAGTRRAERRSGQGHGTKGSAN